MVLFHITRSSIVLLLLIDDYQVLIFEYTLTGCVRAELFGERTSAVLAKTVHLATRINCS